LLSVVVLYPAIAFSQVAPPKVKQELSPIRNVTPQDTTKGYQIRPVASPDSEVRRLSPRINPKSDPTSPPGSMSLFDFRGYVFPILTIDVIDSLGKLYPELKDYMLELATTRGVLQIDSLERARKKLLDRAFADLRLPGELESKMRRNLAVYGTVENPMKPPSAPNQVNIFDVITAVSSLLRYLGLK
jgi:hypothetical protein